MEPHFSLKVCTVNSCKGAEIFSLDPYWEGAQVPVNSLTHTQIKNSMEAHLVAEGGGEPEGRSGASWREDSRNEMGLRGGVNIPQIHYVHVSQ